jgi:hypothetical protein
LSAATIVGYSAASQASPGGSNQPVQANQPALAGHSTIIAPSVGEDTFVPLTPCRIVDTHSGGGAVASGATRTVHAAGTTGFPAQGGKNGGCGVPAAATAVNVSITTSKAKHPGYLTAYPAGTTRPHSRTISYLKSSVLTASSTVKLGGGGQLRFFNHGSTVQVIIDVIGYVIPPIHAIVSPSGGLYAATSRVLSATNTSTGNYTVVTDRDLTGCSVSAGVSGGEYYISAFVSGDNVEATMWSLSGASVVTPTNLFWIFTVTC